tara:strand:- start:622 stop:915 length:294 start_codon:yes stop_codon:yes gene_type:complete
MIIEVDKLDNTKQYMVCFDEIDGLEIHTEASLYNKYKDTNLYNNGSYFGIESIVTGCEIGFYNSEVGYEITLYNYLTNSDDYIGMQFVADNMRITRV